MERLNEIFKRDAQHGHSFQRRRPQGDARTMSSSPSPASPPVRPGSGSAPARRSLPEQTAHIGEYARAYQAERQRLPPPLSSSPSPTTSIPPAPLGGPPSGHQAGYGANRVQAANQPGRGGYPAPTPHRGDTYQPGTNADVQDEWETEEATTMRYGDWESDIYDMPSVPAVPAPQTAHEARPPASPLSRGASRIAQSYPQSNRSFVTRELRRPGDEEEQLYPPRSPVPSVHHVQPAQPAPPLPLQAHIQRVTQPLNRPPRMEKAEQAGPQPIPAPYTNTKTLCPICKGKGYLRADVPYGHPDFGKPIACECKEQERRERRRLQLQELSNLGELHDKRFDNFKPNVSRAAYEAYQIAREYADEPDGWLVFIGGVGCGKTHLAAATANQALANGSRVLFSTVSDLLDHLRATFMPNATEYYDHLFQEMREAELLVLDDLGAQQSSPWANEKLFQLLNYRYNSRFPTIITTNNPGLQGIEERIRSRIMDVSLVRVVTFDQTGDYRLRNPRRA
jgi:DNA replication protein DnaC